MIDFLIGLLLLAILGAAAVYVIIAKKKGQKCIGCPNGCSCGKSGDCSGCGEH